MGITTIEGKCVNLCCQFVCTFNSIELDVTVIVNSCRVCQNANADIAMSQVKCRRYVLGEVLSMVEVFLVRNSDRGRAINDELKNWLILVASDCNYLKINWNVTTTACLFGLCVSAYSTKQ